MRRASQPRRLWIEVLDAQDTVLDALPMPDAQAILAAFGLDVPTAVRAVGGWAAYAAGGWRLGTAWGFTLRGRLRGPNTRVRAAGHTLERR